MKIAVRGGHNPQATGASALINEVTEDRKVKDAVIKYLKQAGHNVLDVTPSNMDSNSDLAYGVNKANSWGAELFISIHFNKAYTSYNGSIGTEVCVHGKFDAAERVVSELSKLGFKNRGQKVRTGLYELGRTSMKAMIVECCFVEATGDVALYQQLGSDRVGEAIAEAVHNGEIRGTVTPPSSGAWYLDNVEIKEQEGFFMQGWMTDSQADLVINGNNYGVRKCDKARADVEKVTGMKGYGFDLGIVKSALQKGKNVVELRGKTASTYYSFDWLW